MARQKWYVASSITPGEANSIQKVPNPGAYTDLNDGDKCLLMHPDGFIRPYEYDDTETDADDGTFIIIPTDNVSGVGAWVTKKSAQSGVYFHGVVTPEFDALVTSNGTVVTMSLEQEGGGDLASVFSDRQHLLDCTPAKTLVLTAGTDTVPVENYVYILKTAPTTLVVSTSDWPTAEHCKIAYALVPSATFVQANGCYVLQNWNDGSGVSGQGHLTHITENIRLTADGAHYHSGVAGAATASAYIEITGTSPSVVEFKSSAGVAYQMHRHTIPAYDMSGSDECLVVNDSIAAYDPISDLADITLDAAGTTLSNKFFNLVFWVALNKTGEYSPLMVNLPTGSYSTLTSAKADLDGHDVYDVPRYFKEESATSMLICRLTCKQTPTATWTLENTTDLRGSTPGTASGSTVGGSTEFSDTLFKVFDNSDDTKVIDFELSGITTANTRTITPADADMTIPSTTNHTDLTDGGETTLHRHPFELLEKSADPTQPSEGEAVIWMSDGTGKGDDGDILMASTAGGVTNYSIIFDHSAGTAW